jgi:hypothetical protein
MSIFITGDLHGATYIDKLRVFAESRGHELSRDDFVIILGDFGLVWKEGNWLGEYWLDWLENRPWTTLFIDGNHENHRLLATYPRRGFRGGMVHEVRPHVLHLMRGYVFDLPAEGGTKSFLAMGGAASHDKQWRTEGVSWWPEEIPSDEERELCELSLSERGWRVDHVLTHDAPSDLVPKLGILSGRGDFKADDYERWLNSVAYRLDFGRWWFGHFHIDRDLGGGFAVLYDEVVRAE